MPPDLRELFLTIARTFTGDVADDSVAEAAVRIGRVAFDPQEQATLVALLRWLASVRDAAPTKWYHPDSSHGCSVPRRNGTCSEHAVGRCVICGRDVCLLHAAVSIQADLVCAACCAYAKASLGNRASARDVPPNAWNPASEPGPKQREKNADGDGEALRKAYRVLGLGRDAGRAEVERRVRELRVRYHPDRKKTPREKSIAEEKFKRIGEAYDTIARSWTSM